MKRFLIALAFSALVSSSAAASTYNYVGLPMSNVTCYYGSCGSGSPINASVTFDFDTSNATGYFTAANFATSDHIVAATISSGCCSSSLAIPVGSFAVEVSLDRGNITLWTVSFFLSSGMNGFGISTTAGGDSYTSGSTSGFFTARNFTPGVWSGPIADTFMGPDTFTTPIPGALPMLLGGLGAIVASARRRRSLGLG